MFVCAKSPLAIRPEITRGPGPLFVTVTGCDTLVVPTAWLLKLSELAESVIEGGTPVPVRLMLCGVPAALSLIVTPPVRAPAVVGANVTLMVQFAP